MTTWYTADLHLGHANIITYCNRPFSTVDEMDRAIIDNWNAQVDMNDWVWILGDVCMGQLARSIALVDEMNGRMMLVPGNHDPVWSGCPESRREKWLEEYQDRFAIFAGYVRGIEGDPFPQRVDASHFPFVGHDHRDFDEHRPIDKGQWLLHGHVHDLYRQRGRQINVGLDAWGGKLVHEDQIRELIEAGENDLESIPWS
jgi:calcineurin-like phosphoesterase family protein